MQEEERVDALIMETKLQAAIVHICHNPRDVFSNQAVYTQAIGLILSTVMPNSNRFVFYMYSYQRDFGWKNHIQEKLEEFLNQRFTSFIKGAVPRSETPLKDEVESVLESLDHPEEIISGLVRL
jgi:hypothetical protein